jgi:hypothetical protein
MYEVAEMSANAAISTKFICVGVISKLLVTSRDGESEMSADISSQLFLLKSGPFGLKGHRASG